MLLPTRVGVIKFPSICWTIRNIKIISNIKKGCTSLNITRKIIFKTTAKIFLYRGIARIIIKDFDQGINDFNKGLNLDPKVIEQNEFELDVLSQETLGMIRSFFNI